MRLPELVLHRLREVKKMARDEKLREEIRQIPKYEFHVHLGGSIRRQTLIELAAKNGVSLPAAKKDFLSVDTLLEFSKGEELWELFHVIYKWCWSCVKNCEDLERIVAEFLEDSYAQGVVHTEFTVSGSYLMNTFPFDEWTDAVRSGIETAQKHFSIKAGTILDISRRFGAENALKTVQEIIKRRPRAICAIGMGGDEAKYPHRLFKDVFKLARENNISTTVHVGEFTGGETTIEAIDELKPHRIGHALTTIQVKEAFEKLKESGLHVECCVLCNFVGGMGILSKLSEHPIRRYYDEGVPVSINTDDPRIFGFDLIDNYINLMKGLDFTMEDFVKINESAKKFAFIK